MVTELRVERGERRVERGERRVERGEMRVMGWAFTAGNYY